VSVSIPEAFISYSREDSEFALRLAQDLKSAGARVWLDQIDIVPGHAWDDAIEGALTEARQMLLILSPASAKSNNVRNEISFALDEGKLIIPVLFIDCAVPLQLRRVQHIDFRCDYDRALSTLLRNLDAAQSADAQVRLQPDAPPLPSGMHAAPLPEAPPPQQHFEAPAQAVPPQQQHFQPKPPTTFIPAPASFAQPAAPAPVFPPALGTPAPARPASPKGKPKPAVLIAIAVAGNLLSFTVGAGFAGGLSTTIKDGVAVSFLTSAISATLIGFIMRYLTRLSRFIWLAAICSPAFFLGYLLAINPPETKPAPMYALECIIIVLAIVHIRNPQPA
jgi:TIR domain